MSPDIIKSTSREEFTQFRGGYKWRGIRFRVTKISEISLFLPIMRAGLSARSVNVALAANVLSDNAIAAANAAQSGDITQGI